MSLINDIVEFVSPYLNGIIEAFKAFMEKVKGIVEKIITKIINFKNQVVDWFRNLPLIKGRHIPFITNKQEFKEMLKNAPVVEVGIFEGVYDEQTDEITDLRYIGAEEYDEKTESLLENEDLVVLA